MLDLRDARALQSEFEGRITSSHQAQAEFPGRPRVLVPRSIADVERALRLAQAADRRVFVRSGGNISATDMSKPLAAAPKRAAAIISMEAFRDVEVGEDRVTVGAAATTGEVARQLVGKNYFLPLGDNPSQSMVSAVLGLDVSPFLRSGAGLGPLRNAVVEAQVVPIAGEGAGLSHTLRDQELRDLLAGDRPPAVVTRLVFEAAASRPKESGRWMQAWTTAYEPRTFAALCDALFGAGGAGGAGFPERADLSVRVTSAAFSMKLVILRATGNGEADGQAAEASVRAALKQAGLSLLDSQRVAGPGSSVAAWVATGPGEAAPGEVMRRFGSNAAARPFAALRSEFLAAVDFTIGIRARTGRGRSPDLGGWAELQLAKEGGVVARAEISDVRGRGVRKASRLMAAATPADDASPAADARQTLVRRAPSRASLRGVEVLPGFAPTPGFDLVASNRAGTNKIPGFKGEVFGASDAGYHQEIQQYAVSSYSQQVVAERMTPLLVAVPLNAADVALAVTYAAKKGLKVVPRSGGHQYCGLSSGGNDTLLLDMKLFTKVTFSPSTGTPTQVTAGPGVRLKDISKLLRKKGVVIPHGECPLVNLGGHLQTGGIGHQLRSLGAMLDWAHSFKLVTRKPGPGPDVYEERELTRPAAAAGTGAPTDADLFGAVLGGGPSSWGVLTEITFDLVSDSEYPTSSGYSYAYPYLLVEGGFSAAMEQLEKWARRQHAKQLPPGVDLFLTVISGDFPRPAALLVETMCRADAGLPEIKAVVDAVDSSVSFLGRLIAHATSDLQGPAGLSVIADDGVRKIGVLGLPKSGREFNLPYKKSLHITKVPFTSAFSRDFVQLVNDAYEHSGLKVVFQAVIGGGDFSANGKKGTTQMQRRDALVQVVFDVFYEPGYENAAVSLQNQMISLLGEFSGGADVRMLWGTFEDSGTHGEQLDMSRSEVQSFYYDSPAVYQRLQKIKAYTDPKDIFHTSFTVQL